MNNNTPLPGMTVTPLYYQTPGWDIFHGGAWAGLLKWALSIPEHTTRFEQDTGLSLKSLTETDPLSRLIDSATGRTDKVMAKWCDWVTIHLWGVEPDFSVPNVLMSQPTKDAKRSDGSSENCNT